MERLKVINLIEGAHLLKAVSLLYKSGLSEILKEPKTVESLVSFSGFEHGKLESMLWYLAERTDFIEKKGEGTYQLNEAYFSYRKSEFLIRQYAQAYSFDGDILEYSLKGVKTVSFVDEEKHALAYKKLEGAGFPFLKKLIGQMDVNCVLEFGCGAGNLLMELAREHKGFRGYGVDANKEMYTRFTENISKYNLSGQLTAFHGNAEKPNGIINEAGLKEVELIVAASLVNSFFSEGEGQIINWLQMMKSVFPDRRLLIADYYGRMGVDHYSNSPEILLHDWVQLISNQGIPPAEEGAWRKIYEKAGCRLLDTMEPEKSLIPFFVHLVSL